VRRALSLALDRYEGSKALSKIAVVKEVAGVQVPGTPYATPPDDLAKLAGYSKDINASRAEAKKLLKDAGAEGLSFTFKNRGVPMPYEPVAVWLIDQWRQVGVTVKQEVIEAAAYYDTLKKGDFQVAMDFQCGYIVEPDLDLYKFTSRSRNPSNYGFYDDKILDDLYTKQSRPRTSRNGRGTCGSSRSVRWTRSALHHDAPVASHHPALEQGPRVADHPSHYLNNQLDTVWLSQ
jgi:peptide/nickel transport system substrate-binding protein